MAAVRIAALALAVLALLPATASAANLTLTDDDGNPRPVSVTPVTLRTMDIRYTLGKEPHEPEYFRITESGPDGAAASTGSCLAWSAVGTLSRHIDYRGNGEYVVLVQTFTDENCTEGGKDQRIGFSIAAGTAVTPPAGVVLTREPNTFSPITHRVPVALNPGASSYEVKYALGGVIGPDGGISGASFDVFPNLDTGLADARFTQPGRYVMVARARRGGYTTPWSAPISFTVKAPFDLLSVFFPDPGGPSYKLRATLREEFARGSRVTVYIAKGRRGGTFRKLGRSSRINAQGRFTLRFKLRKPGVYRLQYRFKGTSLVLGGKVTKAVRLRR